MDSFIFNEYTKRLLNGEVNSSQVWNFLPVNRKFIEPFENCSSMEFRQFRTTADIACYSADGYTTQREEFLKTESYDENERKSMYDVLSSYNGIVNVTISDVKFKRDSDLESKPLYIDDSVTDKELQELYNITLNDTHKLYQKDGFYFVTKVSELNWLSNRCKFNNTFNICLGDNLVGETFTRCIGTYDYPYQGTFDGAGYYISSCDIQVTKDLNGVIGVLGNNGVVKNVRIADMSFNDKNLLTTSYAQKYNSNINVGFVAKNYGNVYDVSSIGTNYVYGLSPAYYFVSNTTDDKNASNDGNGYTYGSAYLIKHPGWASTDVRLYSNGIKYSTPGRSYGIFKNVYLSSNNGTTAIFENGVRKEDILLQALTGEYATRYKEEDYVPDFVLQDWIELDNGEPNHYTNMSNELLFSKIYKLDNFSQLVNHNENSYNIYRTDDITYQTYLNRKLFYNAENKIDYLHIFDTKEESTPFHVVGDDKLYIKGKLYTGTFEETDSDNFYKIEDLNNFYYESNNNNIYVKNGECIDYAKNVHPYFGYFNAYGDRIPSMGKDICKGRNYDLKYTYIVSPIVGSNFNTISGCLNNSNIYFGINKNGDYNPFVGEFGGIAGYSEGIVQSNTSNSKICKYDIKGKNIGYKILSYIDFNEDTRTTLHKDLFNSMFNYDKVKNYLIFGNIVGRCNLYNYEYNDDEDGYDVKSNISDNNSTLIIDNGISNICNKDYCRPSTLIGSMDVYTKDITEKVLKDKNLIYSNNLTIDNNDSNVSSTFYYNEVNLVPFYELSNLVYYNDKVANDKGTNVYYINIEKDGAQNKITEFNDAQSLIYKTIDDNTINGGGSYLEKSYDRFEIDFDYRKNSFITNNFSYIDYNNSLNNCKYNKSLSYGSTSPTILDLTYNKNDVDELDRYFDVKKILLREDYTAINLKPLSAEVNFDFNSANFKLENLEDSLTWGYSGEIEKILQNVEECTGYVINTKDFAGILIYDNSGNLVGYENNYSTNVLYDRYRMNFENNIAMEFK